MSNIIVRTKSELESAIKQGVSRITVEGPFAAEFKKMLKKQKRTKRVAAGGAIAAGALAVGSILAMPFTGGVSVCGLVAAGATATTTAAATSASALALPALALVMGGSLAVYAINKGYKKVAFGPGGTVILERE